MDIVGVCKSSASLGCEYKYILANKTCCNTKVTNEIITHKGEERILKKRILHWREDDGVGCKEDDLWIRPND